MARSLRKKSSTGIYHVMLRGINGQPIFDEEEDRYRLLSTFYRYKRVSGFQLFAYCFMENHIHLLIQENEETISQVVKRVSASYVYWYNRKYERSGYLFQGRFLSEVVENDSYFLTVLRYIHQNPVKAGLQKRVEDYQWTSYHCYLEQNHSARGRFGVGSQDQSKTMPNPTTTPNKDLVDTGYVLRYFSQDTEEALSLFIQFINQYREEDILWPPS